MSEQVPYTGVVLDETLTLSLDEVCEVCGVEQAVVVEMVREGVVEPIEAGGSWTFTGVAVTRLRTAYRLQRDLHVNLAGAALAVELLDEIRRLRRLRDG